MKVMDIGRAPGPWLATALATAGVADIPGLLIDEAGAVFCDDDVGSDQVAALRAAVQAHGQDVAPPAAETDPTAPIIIEAGKAIGESLAAEAQAANVSLDGIAVVLPGRLECPPDTSPQRVAALRALLVAHDPVRSAARSAILAQIRALEASVTPRRLREATRGRDGGWLAALDDQIAALRAQLSG